MDESGTDNRLKRVEKSIQTIQNDIDIINAYLGTDTFELKNKSQTEYVNKEHEQFCSSHAATAENGQEYKALIYTLGIDQQCREHLPELFDGANGLIRPDGLHKPWQTSSSRRITRLAFYLFTWQVPDGEDINDYLIKSLLSGLDADHRRGALLAIDYFG